MSIKPAPAFEQTRIGSCQLSIDPNQYAPGWLHQLSDVVNIDIIMQTTSTVTRCDSKWPRTVHSQSKWFTFTSVRSCAHLTN